MVSLRAQQNRSGITIMPTPSAPRPSMPRGPVVRQVPLSSNFVQSRSGAAPGSLRDRYRQEVAAGRIARSVRSEEEEEDDGGLFDDIGKGLGFIIGNPVSQALLKPLEGLDYGRRAITLGVEELAEALGGRELSTQVDPRTGEVLDDRSNWEKLNDPEYGIGQLLPDVSFDDSLGNFFDKGVGFTGDVALDPLSYVPGIGLATKGGLALSKGVRAGMARELLDKGISDSQVQKFVRKGAGFLTPEEREIAGIGKAGIRVGTNKNNFVLPGTQAIGERVSRGLGTTGDYIRNRSVGEKVANWRTPERVEDAYKSMFQRGGTLDFGTAAERVQMENKWRAGQNMFRGVHDRSTRELRKRSNKLSDEQRAEVINAIETGTIDQIKDQRARDVAKKMQTSFEAMWRDASKQGLNINRRSRYTPHILTRDAAKWIRNAGSDAEGVRSATGLIRDDLFDPSGVTMARQFAPGQTIDVGGTTVTLGDAGILDVNAKLREAGLNFDFYESNPATIMQRYINMLSSDVGQAKAILSRVNAGGGVARLTERQRELLGIEDLNLGRADSTAESVAQGVERTMQGPERFTVRADKVVDDEGNVRYRRAKSSLQPENDLEFVSRQIGEDLDPNIFEVRKAEGKVIKRNKQGQPVLTKQGKAKRKANRKAEEAGEPLQKFEPDDFEMVTPSKTPTEQRAASLVAPLEVRIDTGKQDFNILAKQVEDSIEGARSRGEAAYLEAINGHRQQIKMLEDRIDEVAAAQRSGVAEAQQLDNWINQIDEFLEGMEASLRSLDGAVTRDVRAAESTAVRDRMTELMAERERLRQKAILYQQEGVLRPDIDAADYFRQRANDLAEKMYGPSRDFDEVAGMLEAPGRQQIQDLITERNNLTTRIGNGDRNPAHLDRLAEIDDELARLRGEAPIERDPTIAAAQTRRGELRSQIEKDQAVVKQAAADAQAVERAKAASKSPVIRGTKGQPHVFRTGSGDYKIHKMSGNRYFIEAPDGSDLVEDLGTFTKMDDAVQAADGHFQKQSGKISRFARQRNAKDQLPRLREKANASKRSANQAQKRIDAATEEMSSLPEIPASRDLPEGAIPESAQKLRQEGARRRTRVERMPAGTTPDTSPSQVPNIRPEKPRIPAPEGVRSDSRIVLPTDPEDAARIQQEIDQLEMAAQVRRESAEGAEQAARSTRAVVNARRRMNSAAKNGTINNPKYAKEQAAYNEALREAREAVGVQQMKDEAERYQQLANYRKSQLATPTEAGFTPQQEAELREALANIGAKTNLDQLNELRQASRLAGGTTAGIEELAQTPAIQQEMADIARGGAAGQAKRAEVTAQAGQRARQTRLEKQALQRKGISQAKNWAEPMYLSPRRRRYVERMEKIDPESTARMAEMETLLTNADAQRIAMSEATQNLRSMNMGVLGRIENGKLIPPAKPTTGPKSQAWFDDANARVDELRKIVDDEALEPEVRAAVTKMLDDAVETIAQAKNIDMEAKHLRQLRSDARSGRLGRMIEVQLANGWAAAYPHLVGDDVILSKQLQDSFKRVVDASYHKDFIPYLDSFTNLFKTYATATPGFHVRNALSAMFMNSSDGVPMELQYEALKLFRKYRKAKDPEAWMRAQPDDVREAFEAAFGSGIGGRYTEPGVGQRGKLRLRAQEAAFDNPLTRALGERPGANVEGFVRLAPALQTIRQGGGVDEALTRITRLHFDYSQMSQFDRKARRIIPFWTFMSRNLPLQLSQMYTKPKLYARYNSFVRNVRGEEEPDTPDYFGKIGAFRFGGETMDGLPLYLQPDLAHTRLTEDFDRYQAALEGEDWGQIFSDFNPAITTPIEVATDRNLYTGRTYQPDDLRTGGPLEFPVTALMDLLDLETETPGGNKAYPEKWINAFRSIFPIYDRTIRLAPELTSGRSSDADSRMYESYLRFIGVPVRQLSPEQQLATRRQEFYDELDEADVQRRLMEIDAGL